MTTEVQPSLRLGSLGGGFFFVSSKIFKFWVAIQLLAPLIFLEAFAIPAPPSSNAESGQLPGAEVSQAPSSPGIQPTSSSSLSGTSASSTVHASPTVSAKSGSGTSQLSDSHLAIMLSVIGCMIIAVTAILFLRKWWKKKQRSHGSSEKDEDRQPLSASFQPGELPTLPYWPQPKSPPPQGLA